MLCVCLLVLFLYQKNMLNKINNYNNYVWMYRCILVYTKVFLFSFYNNICSFIFPN